MCSIVKLCELFTFSKLKLVICHKNLYKGSLLDIIVTCFVVDLLWFIRGQLIPYGVRVELKPHIDLLTTCKPY